MILHYNIISIANGNDDDMAMLATVPSIMIQERSCVVCHVISIVAFSCLSSPLLDDTEFRY